MFMRKRKFEQANREAWQRGFDHCKEGQNPKLGRLQHESDTLTRFVNLVNDRLDETRPALGAYKVIEYLTLELLHGKMTEKQYVTAVVESIAWSWYDDGERAEERKARATEDGVNEAMARADRLMQQTAYLKAKV